MTDKRGAKWRPGWLMVPNSCAGKIKGSAHFIPRGGREE